MAIPIGVLGSIPIANECTKLNSWFLCIESIYKKNNPTTKETNVVTYLIYIERLID